MKHFKNLKLRHKKLLDSQGLNHNDFWIERESNKLYRFIEKKTRKVLEIKI